MAIINGTHNHEDIDGTDDPDIIHGFGGEDRISGGKGPDVLHGDERNDWLYGEEGADVLIGGVGDDALDGGPQSDTYVFEPGWGKDVIHNQTNGLLNEQDIVQLGGIDPSEITVSSGYDTAWGWYLELRHGEDDTIVVKDFFSEFNGEEYLVDGIPYQYDSRIDGVQFMSDGTFWDQEDLIALANGTYGNAPPVLSIGTDAITVNENTTAAVATFGAYDADGDDLEWSLNLYNYVTGKYDADGTAFTIEDGVLSFVSPPDYENPTDRNKDNTHVLTIEVSDGTESAYQTVWVTVADVTETVRITSNGGSKHASLSVAENSKKVTKVAATGTSAELTYSIIGGADAGKFQINGKTGALTFAAAPDFENPTDSGKDNVYNVKVKASDGSLSDTQALKVTVTDVMEVVRGTPDPDNLRGTGRSDTLDGGAGADTMSGLEGSDVYVVDDARDSVVENAGEGTDLVRASVSHRLADNVENLTLTGSGAIDGTGNGLDNAITGNSGDNLLKGGAGSDTLEGGGGRDLLYGNKGNDELRGGKGKDTLDGGSGRDVLHGDKGNDELRGGKGNDTLDGGNGNDLLKGNAGKDELDGGRGADTLQGGSGADTFVFKSVAESTVKKSGRDTIDDFSRGEKDRIDLSGIDADTSSAGDQGFTFIGQDNFHRTAGELRYDKLGDTTLITGDVDGDGTADFAILVDVSLTLANGDFIL